jgi:hypothetical protein
MSKNYRKRENYIWINIKWINWSDVYDFAITFGKILRIIDLNKIEK